MSNSGRLLFTAMLVIVVLGTAFVCRPRHSSAQSQNDESAAGQESKASQNFPHSIQTVNGQPKDGQDSPRGVSAAVSEFDRQFTKQRGKASHYFLEVFSPANQTGTVLGVHVSDASAALRKHLKLPAQFGLLVEHVEPGGAAALARLQRFDVIHKLDDQLLVNREQLTALVRMHKPKDPVSLTLYRDGDEMIVKVVLGSGQIVDKSSPKWEGRSLSPAELRNHASLPKFSNCQACHQNPFGPRPAKPAK